MESILLIFYLGILFLVAKFHSIKPFTVVNLKYLIYGPNFVNLGCLLSL